MQNEELRRVQEELEWSRKKHFDLYDLTPVGYLTLGNDELIMEANLKASTLLGVSIDNLVKKLLTSFILPEDQDTFYRQYKRLRDTRTPQEFELRMLRKEDNQFWVPIQANVADDADDAVMWRVVISDISEHKQAEEALHISEKRYRSLFETARDGILILDAETGQIADVNPFLAEMLGYSHEEFLGKKLREIGAFKDVEASKAAFLESQSKGYFCYNDLPYAWMRSGSCRWRCRPSCSG